jgi:flagellar biosynthesis protein FlhG
MDQAQSLRESIEAYKKKKQIKAEKQIKIIAVSSGKGGVGKTNFSVNLAIALQELGKKVVIFDADLGMANVDVIVGAAPKYNLYDVIFNNKNLEDIIIQGPSGVRIIPGGSGIESLSNLTDTQRKNLSEKFGQIKDANMLIIDTGAGLSKNVLGFMAVSDEVVVVTTPEPTSLTDAYSLIKVGLKYMPKMKINIVVNRVQDENEAVTTYQRLEKAVRDFLKKDLNYFGYVIDDIKVKKAVMEQIPFKVIYPDCSASKCVNSIAYSISGLQVQTKKTGGLKDFMARITYLFGKQ